MKRTVKAPTTKPFVIIGLIIRSISDVTERGKKAITVPRRRGKSTIIPSSTLLNVLFSTESIIAAPICAVIKYNKITLITGGSIAVKTPRAAGEKARIKRPAAAGIRVNLDAFCVATIMPGLKE